MADPIAALEPMFVLAWQSHRPDDGQGVDLYLCADEAEAWTPLPGGLRRVGSRPGHRLRRHG